MIRKTMLVLACVGWLLFVPQQSLLAEESVTTTPSSNDADGTDQSSEAGETWWDWWIWDLSALAGGYGSSDQEAAGTWSGYFWDLGW